MAKINEDVVTDCSTMMESLIRNTSQLTDKLSGLNVQQRKEVRQTFVKNNILPYVRNCGNPSLTKSGNGCATCKGVWPDVRTYGTPKKKTVSMPTTIPFGKVVMGFKFPSRREYKRMSAQGRSKLNKQAKFVMARKQIKEQGLTATQAQATLGHEKYKERYDKRVENKKYKP